MTKTRPETDVESEQAGADGGKLVFQRVMTDPLSPTIAANPRSEGAASPKQSLFGCLRGTVMSTGDLTEPADPEWARRSGNE